MIHALAIVLMWAIWLWGVVTASAAQSIGLAVANGVGAAMLMLPSKRMPSSIQPQIAIMAGSLFALGCGDALFALVSNCDQTACAAKSFSDMCYMVGTVGFLAAGVLTPYSLEQSKMLPEYSNMRILGIAGVIAAIASFGGIALSGKIDTKTLLYSFSAFFLAGIFIQIVLQLQTEFSLKNFATKAVRTLSISFVVASIAQVVRIVAVDANGVPFLPWAYDAIWIVAMSILVIGLRPTAAALSQE